MKPIQFAAATLLCVVVLGALGVAAYSRSVASQAKAAALPEKARSKGAPMPVRSVVVHETEYTQVIGATAVTEASLKAIVRYSGPADPTGQLPVIASVAAREGQWVKEGETLFETERDMIELHARQAEATQASAEAELDGIQKLYSRKAASAYEVRGAELRLMTAKLETEMARRRLETAAVTSPVTGQLDLVSVVPGEAISGGQMLTTVYQLDPIHIRVEVPQERAAEVVEGAQAEIVIDSFPQEVFKGAVVSLSPQVDPETRVLSAVVSAPNPEHRIKAGMSGFVRFQAVKAGLVAADAAIVELDGKASVFVVNDGRAELRSIRTGPLVETGKRVIEWGLADGDEVVVFGQQDLQDQDLVDTDWKSWTRRTVSDEPAPAPEGAEPASSGDTPDGEPVATPETVLESVSVEQAAPTLVTAAGR